MFLITDEFKRHYNKQDKPNRYQCSFFEMRKFLTTSFSAFGSSSTLRRFIVLIIDLGITPTWLLLVTVSSNLSMVFC